MPTRLWRFLAVAGALFALVFVGLDTVDVAGYVDDHIGVDRIDASPMQLRVTDVTGTATESGGLRPGDIIRPAGPLTMRMRFGAEAAGQSFVWAVQRGAQRFTTRTFVTPDTFNNVLLDEIFNVVRFAMLGVALVVAVRRPDIAAARALVEFLITIALTLMPGGTWLPDPAFAAWRVLHAPVQIFSLGAGLRYACIFPFASTSGPRAWIRRFNPWFTGITAIAVSVLIGLTDIAGTLANLPSVVRRFLNYSPLLYFVLIPIAFVYAARGATGRDRQRVLWAAGSIGIGFLGPLIVSLEYISGHQIDALSLLPLTLIAMPLGLAYTILRHRTIDVGFVINRALVLTILSFAVIAAFGLVERTLGKIFIDASHIASRSVEIALALGLGFSLRTLHTRVERLVDRVFFRERQRALAELRAFASDVYFITDPDVAIERTVAIAGRCNDAENVALYLIDGTAFGRAQALDPATLPIAIDENDPLFVRMRASRHAELPRIAGSAIDVEIAFPMFVRGTLAGALLLAPKRSGEAYDPEETALLSDVAQRVGLALDALQTLAMRRELDTLQRA